MIEKRTAKNNWYKQTSKAIQKLNGIQGLADCRGWVRQADDQLESFETLKVYNLLCKELQICVLYEIWRKRAFYTAQELATVLGINVMTIYRYIGAKKLQAYKIGKEYRIEKREFEKFLNSVKTK